MHFIDAEENSDCTWGVNGALLGYVENIEYSNQFRKGQTLLGCWVKSRIFYQPVSKFVFSAGFFGNRYFGDSSFFTIIRPVLSAQYISNGFNFVIGELYTPSEHDFPDYLFRTEFRYQPGEFEGIQLIYSNATIKQDSWVQWYALNEPTQREHFAFGNNTRFLIDPFSIFLTLVIDHYGGEQFSPENDPVRENYCSGIGIDATIQRTGFVQKFYGRIQGAFSATRNRSLDSRYKKGWGVLGLATIGFKYFDIGLQLFKGNELIGTLGNPVYRTDLPYLSLQVSKKYTVKFVNVDLGIDFEIVDTPFSNYFKTFQHRWWVSMGGDYSSFLKIRRR